MYGSRDLNDKNDHIYYFPIVLAIRICIGLAVLTDFCETNDSHLAKEQNTACE